MVNGQMIPDAILEVSPRERAVCSRTEILLPILDISVHTSLKVGLNQVNLVGMSVLYDLFRVSLHDFSAEVALQMPVLSKSINSKTMCHL